MWDLSKFYFAKWSQNLLTNVHFFYLYGLSSNKNLREKAKPHFFLEKSHHRRKSLLHTFPVREDDGFSFTIFGSCLLSSSCSHFIAVVNDYLVFGVFKKYIYVVVFIQPLKRLVDKDYLKNIKNKLVLHFLSSFSNQTAPPEHDFVSKKVEKEAVCVFSMIIMMVFILKRKGLHKKCTGRQKVE